MTFDLISFVIGVAAGGLAAAMSAKFLGFWNKQAASIEKKV
jgi:hypothetical protein